MNSCHFQLRMKNKSSFILKNILYLFLMYYIIEFNLQYKYLFIVIRNCIVILEKKKFKNKKSKYDLQFSKKLFMKLYIKERN